MTASISATRSLQQTYPDWASTLLARYRRYSTRDLIDVQGRFRGLDDGVSLSVARPEDFVSYNEMRLPLGRLVLGIGCIETQNGYNLSFKSGDEYVINIPRQGSGWLSTGDIFVEYGFGDVMIIAPFCRVKKHWEGPGEVLSIHVPTESFDAALSRLGLAALPAGPIIRIESQRLRSFLRVLDMICRDLQDSDGPSPFLRKPLSDQTEQMLLTLLLEGMVIQSSGKAETAPISPALPYYVRRAEKFITTNAHRQIGIDEIANASGVSARAVQYGFRAFLKTTPMQYAKRVRYERARSILLLDRFSRKISDIAAEIGCANVSQFSRDYRSLFGETPSETMATVRRLVS